LFESEYVVVQKTDFSSGRTAVVLAALVHSLRRNTSEPEHAPIRRGFPVLMEALGFHYLVPIYTHTLPIKPIV
jgi:hypothetical protein